MIKETAVKYVYLVNGRRIALDANRVERFSTYICPIDEDYLSVQLNLLNEKHSDSLMSIEIESDMERELNECGV